jgi:hypothetical protein
MSKPLTTRALNRATLARQMLLERSDRGIVESAAFLGGLQAQQSNDPYIGLWSRLQNFRHEDLTALVVDRTLLRGTTMRGTLHLHTATDFVGFRALVQPFLSQQWNSNFLKRFGGEDEKKALRFGTRLLDRGPLKAGAIGAALREKFPRAEPQALASLIALQDTLVQIPPTRIWGNNAAPLLARIGNWLDEVPAPTLSRTELVRRYLAAYGPASVADMATWSRLTRLGEAFKEIEDELVVFTGEDGRTLYDLADAPRPDEDVPAPVRFLPLYDNAYLGYDKRQRMLNEATAHLINMFQAFKPAVLIDGTVAAGWSVTVEKHAAVLGIDLYRKVTKREARELEAEGLAFLRFMQPDSANVEVRLEDKT